MRILALMALGLAVAGCSVLPLPGRSDLGAATVPAEASASAQPAADAAVSAPQAAPGALGAEAPAEEPARLTLTAITIERLSELPQESAVSDADLLAIAEPRIGTEVSLTDLRAIATGMEGVFRRAGYPYVRVVLPPQEVDGGIVRFQVVEGHIRGVVVLGDDPVAKRQAEARLAPLDGEGPVSVSKVERAVGLLSDVPGLRSRVSLARGTEGPGSMRVVADASREEPRFLVNAHNWGAESLGREGTTFLMRMPGWSDFGDELQASAFTTLDWGEQWVGQLAYERWLTADGLKVRAEVTYGRAEPGGVVQTLGATSKSLTGDLSFSYPVLIDRHTKLEAIAGADLSNLKGELFQGSVLLSEDKTRAGYLAFDLETEFYDWTLDSRFDVRKGLDFFDGSNRGDSNLARTDAHPDALIFKGDIALSSPDYAGFSLDVRALGQFSRDPLMAVEEFSFGNYTIVRGYDPGSAAGDSAVAVAADIEAPGLDFMGNRLHVTPFGFFDVGEYWNRDTTSVENRTVASTGGGLRFSLDGYARAEVMWAKPLREPRGQGESVPGSRVLFSITTSLNRLAEDVGDLFSSLGALTADEGE